ncbi:MAG: dCTP deaminase domain-containing protein [Terracidiphilus sp.]
MAKILADKDIQKLLGTVIQNADEKRINPNGIEIRLGKHVLFHSTDEEKELGPDMFLKVLPGESVTISSFEVVDFRSDTVQKVFPGCNMMALITPTTTMMREGITQPSTKIDSGWNGKLNWGLRNSSIRDLVIGFGEPIFKLTFFLLDGDEIPDTPYGDRPDDRYQNTEGIARSTRKIPATIPTKRMVSSSVEKLDPQKQLREAGYPFNHISEELTTLHGNFVTVSTDVALLKNAITDETKKLTDKLDAAQITLLEKVEHLFHRKFVQIVGAVVSCFTVMFAIYTFLKVNGVQGALMGWFALAGGLLIGLIVYIVGRHDTPTA